MFMGQHTPKLDDKGRFFLPARFRAELADGVVITKSQERCLAIYPVGVYAEILRRATAAPTALKKVRDYQRYLAAQASEERPDAQGRLTIPPMHRKYAGLVKDIAVVGAVDRLEVWDLEAWEAYSEANESEFADLDEEVFPGL